MPETFLPLAVKPDGTKRDAAHRSDPLRRDVNTLGAMLGETIVELAGNTTFHRIENIRRLSRSRRLGDATAGSGLAEAIHSLDLDGMEEVIRAFTLFFDFSNIAEDRHRIRVLRQRQRESAKPLAESIGAALESLRARGCSHNDVQAILSRIAVELVFTAHPSEAKRRTVRSKLRRMRHYLQEMDRNDLLPSEREDLQQKMNTEAQVLWQTEPLRPRRPTVLEEVDRCLALAPRLWEVLPRAYASLRRALSEHYPDAKFEVPIFLRFGTWVGGDRDGHPDVSNAVTRETLLHLRHNALLLHLKQCDKLRDLLSVSRRLAPVLPALDQWLADAALRWPQAAKASEASPPAETYRRFLDVVAWRLKQSMGNAGLADQAARSHYRDGNELAADIELLMTSLQATESTRALAAEVQGWHDLTRSFGLQMGQLDIRHDSASIATAIGEVLAAAGICHDYATLEESHKCGVLTSHLSWAEPVPTERLSAEAREMLGLFGLLEETIFHYGPEAIGGFIISMTRAASDVLAVLWFWRHAQHIHGNRAGELRIIPLFERIVDLANAAKTLDGILSNPAYLRSLVRQQLRQTVMLGYSDSTKDGGYLAACWGLWLAQTALQEVAGRHGIAVTFFHGRGGSLGRGGGPAARGILSLPRKAFDGSLRLTEQGEVLVERYDDVQIAARHLDQVVGATLMAASEPGREADGAWITAMEEIAQRSLAAYQDLVNTPGFLRFFALATPIDEIEDLPIGSRPARRRARTSLADLRAIPWVFSWTQNRCIIPAWYGLGTALQPFVGGPGLELLNQMYRRWPFFQATLDNAELALAKADLFVAGEYAQLAGAEAAAVWQKIQAEYELSLKAVRAVTGHSQLLSEVPWFQASIEARNPYVDPLNLIQIELLRRRMSLDEAAETTEIDRLHHLLRLSIQGIAAGLRTTG